MVKRGACLNDPDVCLRGFLRDLHGSQSDRSVPLPLLLSCFSGVTVREPMGEGSPVDDSQFIAAFVGSAPCSRATWQRSEGVLTPPPPTRAPPMFYLHRGLNPEPSTSQPGPPTPRNNGWRSSLKCPTDMGSDPFGVQVLASG